MSLAGFWSGWQDAAESIQRERINRLRGGILENEMALAQDAQKLDQDRRSYIAQHMAGPGSQPELTTTTTPGRTMVEQGILPTTPNMAQIESAAQNPDYGASTAQATTTEIPATITSTARRKDPVEEARKAEEAFFIQKGRPELAQAAREARMKHYETLNREAQAKWASKMLPTAQGAEQMKMGLNRSQLIGEAWRRAVEAQTGGQTKIAVDTINMVNDWLSKDGAPLFDGRAADLQVGKDGSITLIGETGKPLTAPGTNKPLQSTAAQWAALGGMDTGQKMTIIPEGAAALLTGPRGQVTGAFQNPKENAEKPGLMFQKYKDADNNIRIALGSKAMAAGIYGDVDPENTIRYQAYRQRLDEAMAAGVDPTPMATALRDHYNRDRAAGKDRFSRNTIPTLQSVYGGGQGAAAQPSGADPLDELMKRAGIEAAGPTRR